MYDAWCCKLFPRESKLIWDGMTIFQEIIFFWVVEESEVTGPDIYEVVDEPRRHTDDSCQSAADNLPDQRSRVNLDFTDILTICRCPEANLKLVTFKESFVDKNGMFGLFLSCVLSEQCTWYKSERGELHWTLAPPTKLHFYFIKHSPQPLLNHNHYLQNLENFFPQAFLYFGERWTTKSIQEQMLLLVNILSCCHKEGKWILLLNFNISFCSMMLLKVYQPRRIMICI